MPADPKALAEAIDCPHCGRTFATPNDRFQHVKAKHGRKAARAFRPVVEREPSLGEQVIAAMEAKAAGLPVDPVIAMMFGDYLDG